MVTRRLIDSAVEQFLNEYPMRGFHCLLWQRCQLSRDQQIVDRVNSKQQIENGSPQVLLSWCWLIPRQPLTAVIGTHWCRHCGAATKTRTALSGRDGDGWGRWSKSQGVMLATRTASAQETMCQVWSRSNIDGSMQDYIDCISMVVLLTWVST